MERMVAVAGTWWLQAMAPSPFGSRGADNGTGGRSAGRPNAPVAVVRPSRLSDLRPGVPHRGGSPLLFVRLPAHLRRCSPPNSPVVIHRRQHASSKSDSDPPSQTKQHQSYDNQAPLARGNDARGTFWRDRDAVIHRMLSWLRFSFLQI
jgi:hypothetical protein